MNLEEVFVEERGLKRNLRCAGAIGAAVLAFSVSAQGQQQYPAKPIRLLLPFAAGSGGDAATRVVTVPLGEALGQPIVIDNRAGAGGSIVADMTAKAPPDGYTLMVNIGGAVVYRPFLVKNTSYDGIRDFTPIGILGDTSAVIMVANSVPITTLHQLIEYARANPNKLSYGTSGVGTNYHLSMEQIQTVTGAKFVHVPYKSANQAMLDVVGGQIPMAFGIIGPAAPLVKAGKMRAVAIEADKRNPRLPDVPAIREALPDFERSPAWMALFGPRALPLELTQRLNTEMNRVIARPAVGSRLEDTGFDVVSVTPEEFAAIVRRNVALAAKVIKAAGIEPE
jgi:tripartite-type tricarboxylate transporter receptor subunit TctC